mmetsp:Transcript_55408/g.127383  ORF Transcript_55408/g.127383 Transcript_55408/m.127383 type:complete len:310 (-) Transcript_55408:1285-2214(-)
MLGPGFRTVSGIPAPAPTSTPRGVAEAGSSTNTATVPGSSRRRLAKTPCSSPPSHQRSKPSRAISPSNCTVSVTPPDSGTPRSVQDATFHSPSKQSRSPDFCNPGRHCSVQKSPGSRPVQSGSSSDPGITTSGQYRSQVASSHFPLLQNRSADACRLPLHGSGHDPPLSTPAQWARSAALGISGGSSHLLGTHATSPVCHSPRKQVSAPVRLNPAEHSNSQDCPFSMPTQPAMSSAATRDKAAGVESHRASSHTGPSNRPTSLQNKAGAGFPLVDSKGLVILDNRYPGSHRTAQGPSPADPIHADMSAA